MFGDRTPGRAKLSRRKAIGLVATALAVSLAAFSGCEESAKNSAQVRQPAVTPRPAASSAVAANVGELPFPQNAPDFIALTPMERPSVDALIDQVEATLNAPLDRPAAPR